MRNPPNFAPNCKRFSSELDLQKQLQIQSKNAQNRNPNLVKEEKVRNPSLRELLLQNPNPNNVCKRRIYIPRKWAKTRPKWKVSKLLDIFMSDIKGYDVSTLLLVEISSVSTGGLMLQHGW